VRVRAVILPAALAIAAATAAAQESSAQDPAPRTQPATSLPKMGEVLDAIDQASAPAPDGKGKDWSGPVKLAVVFIGLALLPSVLVFLTIFTMTPTLGRINEQALKPYNAQQINFSEAVTRANNLLKEFMLRQTRPADLELFVSLAGIQSPSTVEAVPMHVAIPSFAVSEFRTAFRMGCLLFIPFLLIDLVVAGILLSTGMMMLPPVIVSLPFKIILFILVDGWSLLAKALVKSFFY